MNYKILVTGHRGYIGSALYEELLKLGHQVTGIDQKEAKDVLYDLPDEKHDFVFHLAAYPSVQQSVSEPSKTFRNNAYGTSVLLEWAKNHGVRRVIFSSSSAVKGSGAGPSSPYGLHKKISEQECALYSALYGLDTVCLRYYNVYSREQRYGGAYSTAICAWMEMIRKGRTLRIDGDGEQTRDFVHRSDVVSANIFCMNHRENFSGRTLDIGSGESFSLNRIREIIEKEHDVKWSQAPERIGDIKHSKSDISQMLAMGWKPRITTEEGIIGCFRGLEKDEI